MLNNVGMGGAASPSAGSSPSESSHSPPLGAARGEARALQLAEEVEALTRKLAAAANPAVITLFHSALTAKERELRALTDTLFPMVMPPQPPAGPPRMEPPPRQPQPPPGPPPGGQSFTFGGPQGGGEGFMG